MRRGPQIHRLRISLSPVFNYVKRDDFGWSEKKKTHRARLLFILLAGGRYRCCFRGQCCNEGPGGGGGGKGPTCMVNLVQSSVFQPRWIQWEDKGRVTSKVDITGENSKKIKPWRGKQPEPSQLEVMFNTVKKIITLSSFCDKVGRRTKSDCVLSATNEMTKRNSGKKKTCSQPFRAAIERETDWNKRGR